MSAGSLKARTHVAQEILSTERAYVDFLRTLQDCFEVPAKTSVGSRRPLMDQQEVSLVFGLLAPIYAGAGDFLARLSSLMENWDPSTTLLSPVFLEAEGYLNDYSPFVNHFSEISALVHRLNETKSEFRAWIAEQRKLPRVADRYLIDFLIMPVQRIPRYSLLLRELLKVTPADHPDAGGLALALQKLDGINSFLNEQKRKSEDFSRILALQDKLTGKLADEFKVTSGYRKIVREELVAMLVPDPADGSWKEKRLTLVLLSDMLLVCEKKSYFHQEQYHVVRYMWLNEVIHVVRPFLQSTTKRHVFQLLRNASSGSTDRRSLHVHAELGIEDPQSGLATSANSERGLAALVLANSHVVDAICAHTTKPTEAGSLACVYLKKGTGNSLVQQMVRAELAACTTEAEVFRIPSVRSVVVMRYCRLVASEYLSQIIRPVLEQAGGLSAEALDVESSDPIIRSNVITQLQNLLDNMCNSSGSVPAELRQAFASVSEAVSARAEGAELPVLCHIFVDKLVLAALMQPVSFGCLHEDLPPSHGRLVELLRSAVVKVASRRFFDESSPVAYLNKIVGLYHRRFYEFLGDISKYDRYSSKYPRAPKVSSVVYQTALMDLHSCVSHDLPVFSKSAKDCYDAMAEAVAMESVGPNAQTEALLFYPLEMEGKDIDIITEHASDWLKELSKWVEDSKSGEVQAAPRGVVNPSTKSSMLHKKVSSNVLADAAKLAKERLSKSAPIEEEIHRNLRGKVIQSGYLWERRLFIVTEHGIFVQERPNLAEMVPVQIDASLAKVERIEGVAEWQNAMRLCTNDVEYSLMADTEEEVFRFKNAVATLKVKEESRVVRKAQEAIQAVNKGGSISKRSSTLKLKRGSEHSAPSEKEAQLLGILAASSGSIGSGGGGGGGSTEESDPSPKLGSLSSVASFESPAALRRDEKQQQMIRDVMKTKRTSSVPTPLSAAAIASAGSSSSSSSASMSSVAAVAVSSDASAAPTHKRVESKSKFSTLVGRVKSELGELKVRKADSSSKMRHSTQLPASQIFDSSAPSNPQPAATSVSAPVVSTSGGDSSSASSSASATAASSPPHNPAPPASLLEKAVQTRVSSPGNLQSGRPVSATKEPVVIRYCVATFDFEPEEEGEIPFKTGERLAVLSYDPNGWGVGRNPAGQTGEFPVNRVRFIDESSGSTDALVHTLSNLMDDDDDDDGQDMDEPEDESASVTSPIAAAVSPRPLPPPPANVASPRQSGGPPVPTAKKPKLALKKQVSGMKGDAAATGGATGSTGQRAPPKQQ